MKRARGMMAAALAAGLAVLSARAEDAYDRIKAYDFNGPEADLAAVRTEVVAALKGEADRAAIETRLVAVLSDGASTFAARQFVCRQLAVLGTDKCVPALAALLGDEKMGDMARYALGRIETPAAGEALRAALSKLTGRPLIGVVNTLGERRDAAALAGLKTLLASNEADLRAAAVTAVGRIGTAEALAALRALPGALQDRGVVAATIECASRVARAGNARAAGDAYAAIHEAAGAPPAARAAALGGLLLTRPETATATLLAQFSGPDEKLRLAAAKYIRDFPGADVTRAFADHLGKLPPDAQALLIASLAGRGDPAAVPAILKAAAGPDEAVRAAALDALGALNADGTAVPLLVERAAAAAGDEQAAARRSLAATRGEGVDKALASAAQAGDAARRAAAIDALASRRVKSAAAGLLRMAGDADPAVRAASLRALAVLAGPEHVSALVAVLVKSADAGERGLASKAVIAAAKPVADEAARTKPLVEALEGASPEAGGAIVMTMARLGGAPALAAARKAAAGGPLHEDAVRALADWSDASAIGPLTEVIASTQDSRERTMALRGLVRLMDEPSQRTPEQTVELYRKALASASTPDEKKAILPGLGKFGSPEALRLVQPLCEQPEVREEAALALAGIARAMAPSFPNEARAAADRLLQGGSSDAVKARARETMEFLDRNEGYIVTWRMSEVQTVEGKDGAALFNLALPPEANPEAGTWKVVPANERDIILNFDPLGGDDRAVYLKAELTVPADTPARLEIGSDDGVKAWLNGELVHQNDVVRPVTPGSDKVDVTLKAGVNKLMLKVVDRAGNWGACCRVCTRDGSHVPGLAIKPSPDEVQWRF